MASVFSASWLVSSFFARRTPSMSRTTFSWAFFRSKRRSFRELLRAVFSRIALSCDLRWACRDLSEVAREMFSSKRFSMLVLVSSTVLKCSSIKGVWDWRKRRKLIM